MLHDRYLGVESGVDHSIAIPFHWSKGAGLLNDKLSNGVKPEERDALWLCAGLLGTLAFASIQAKTPEEAWPLKQSSSLSDLDWLRMSQGKREIWSIADPFRADSLFYPLACHYMQLSNVRPVSYPGPELQTLPPELIELCNIDSMSTVANNPYLATASVLAQLLDLDCGGRNAGKFMCFFGNIHRSFRDLLEQKDPCALLLLAYWYAKISHLRQWWSYDRAALECQAICIHLQTYHEKDSKISRLLEYPTTMCSLGQC